MFLPDAIHQRLPHSPDTKFQHNSQ